MRVGIGYDVHRLVPGRPLILGGVLLEFDKGLAGHSDADVLTHAVCDAILGAAGLGDIGIHFPDTDPNFKGIQSLLLLRRVCEMIHERGLAVINIDSTVFAEAPKIAPHREEMAHNLAKSAGVLPQRVNVKATTSEGLGWAGRGEGIGAMAVALLSFRE